MHDDLVAGLPARDAGADLPDDAGGVRAADVVVLLGVVAEDRHRLAERRPHVVEVHAGRHHAHDDLEGARLGHLDLLELEGVDGLALALLADDPRGHRLRQLAGLGVDVRDLRQIDGHLGCAPESYVLAVLYVRVQRRSRTLPALDVAGAQKQHGGDDQRRAASRPRRGSGTPRRVDVAHQPAEVLAEEAGDERQRQEDRARRSSARGRRVEPVGDGRRRRGRAPRTAVAEAVELARRCARGGRRRRARQSRASSRLQAGQAARAGRRRARACRAGRARPGAARRARGAGGACAGALGRLGCSSISLLERVDLVVDGASSDRRRTRRSARRGRGRRAPPRCRIVVVRRCARAASPQLRRTGSRRTVTIARP